VARCWHSDPKYFYRDISLSRFLFLKWWSTGTVMPNVFTTIILYDKNCAKMVEQDNLPFFGLALTTVDERPCFAFLLAVRLLFAKVHSCLHD
jgi:hypothetical protein